MQVGGPHDASPLSLQSSVPPEYRIPNPAHLLESLQSAVGDRYRVERELGGGGMSRVFLATEVTLGRAVVIKVLAPEIASVVTAARFKRETEITAQLQHPHILPVLTAGAEQDLLFYVSPYVEGESLRHRMTREGKLPVSDVVRILSEVASALAYAHERGVVHRDIKPENILLSNGHAVLADFGISSLSEQLTETPGGTRLTIAGTSLGTPGYMSPEQASGDVNIDGRSDLYSLGVVGFEMLAGQPPFAGSTHAELLVQHLTAPVPSPSAFRTDVPTELSAALGRAMAKSPNDRFANAGAFRDALTATGRPTARPRSPRVAWAFGAAAVIAVAAVIWMTTRREPDTVAAVDNGNLVAIAPFDAFGPEARMWREGMVDLLAANLDGAGSLRAVSTTAVMRAWPDSARADRASALALARKVGAGLAIFGTAVPAGPDSLRLRVAILDAVTDARVGTEIEIIGESTRIDRLSDTLSIALLTTLNQARRVGATKRPSLGSSSLPAIKSFLWGETHYRRGSWDSAAVHYRQALAADSQYASAMWRLGNALGWQLAANLRPDVESYQLLLKAGTLNRGLAPRESVLVAADSLFASLMLTQREGPTTDRYHRVVRMTQLMERAAERFGDDPEIFYKLGDVRFHFTRELAPRLPRAGDSHRAFAQAVQLDSTYAAAYPHLIELTAESQDLAALRRHLGNYLRLGPTGDQAEALALAARAIDPRQPQLPNTDSLLRGRLGIVVRDLVTALRGLLDTNETTVRVFRTSLSLSLDARLPDEFINSVRWGATTALSLRGHFEELGRIATPSQSLLLYYAALAGALPPDSMDRVAGRLAASGDPSGPALSLFWWAERRDTASINAVLGKLRAKPAQPAYTFLQPFLPAVDALAHADTARAIAALALPDTVCRLGCSSADFLRLRLLSAQRKDSLALELIDLPVRFNDGSMVLWQMERARVLERAGDRPRAIDAYSYVVSAWERGDASVQGIVTEARAGLRRLSADPTR